MKSEVIQIIGSSLKSQMLVEIKPGLKIEVRDFVLKEIQSQQYIKDNFQLNIKRLNRWWYSVYFKEIIN